MGKTFLDEQKHFFLISVLYNFFTIRVHIRTFHKFAAHFEQNKKFFVFTKFRTLFLYELSRSEDLVQNKIGK